MCLYFVVEVWGFLVCFVCLFVFEGYPSPEPGKICAALNPGKGAKWENRDCNQKLGYICKRGNATLESFIIPTGRFDNKPSNKLLMITCNSNRYSLLCMIKASKGLCIQWLDQDFL